MLPTGSMVMGSARNVALNLLVGAPLVAVDAGVGAQDVLNRRRGHNAHLAPGQPRLRRRPRRQPVDRPAHRHRRRPAPTGVLIHPGHLREPDDPPTSPPLKPSSGGTGDPPEQPGGDPGSDPGAVPPTEFYAQFKLRFVRCIRQLDSIIENVASKLDDPDIELVLETRAKNQQGFNEHTQRTVSENARNLEDQSSELE